jgi:hypothetical protein
MPELIIRVVALLGGLVVGVVAWTAVALQMRQAVLVRVGMRHVGVVRAVFIGLLVVLAITWVVSPIRGSPWIWPGALVGILGSALMFRLARIGRLPRASR